MARGLPTGPARLASARDVASRDARRAAANRAVRQRHPPTEEHLVSIDQLSPPGTEVVDVRNPATGELVGSVAVQSAEAVAAVVDELRTHQSSWEALGPDARAVWLRKLRNWLLDNESRLIDILAAETGKPRAEASVRNHGHLRRDQLLRRPGTEVPRRKEVQTARSAHRHQEAHQGVPPVPGRRRDHAVELPVTHPRCRRRCGAAGRGGRPRQALGGHSAVRLRTRPRLGTDRCTAGVRVCHRSGRNGRSGSGLRGHGAVHRLHQDRTGHRRAGGRTIDSLRRRAGRQGPGHRPGRRRSFARRQRHRVGGAVQLGSGLHLGGAGVRRGTGL